MISSKTVAKRFGVGELTSYLVVGAIGFAIEAFLLTVLAGAAQMNVYAARAVSFLSATLVTWQMNRRFTFVHRSAGLPRNAPGLQYARYIVVQLTGAGTNLAVFVALVEQLPLLRAWPVLPLAVGAALGLIVNFTGARYWVYRG
jgi:putative flippase GtrA